MIFFSVVKTQILFLETLPSINIIYSLVAQEESNMIPTSNIEASSLLANAFDAKRGRGRGRDSFGKINFNFAHIATNMDTIDFCYQKHGHP